jgi:hypothetical protein
VMDEAIGKLFIMRVVLGQIHSRVILYNAFWNNRSDRSSLVELGNRQDRGPGISS